MDDETLRTHDSSARPKTGGRKKGTPNKATLKVRQAFENYGICPLSSILEISEDLGPMEKIQVYLSLLPYLYPKRKPEDGQAIAFNLFSE